MALIRPDYIVRRVYDIAPELLQAHGVRALVLDVDNTLTTHNNPKPDKAVLAWLDEMKGCGLTPVLLSNNSAKRVGPFAERLGLPFSARAAKPLPIGMHRAAKSLGLRPGEIAVVGDQLFTDIIGGNLFGGLTILVEPMEPETGPLFRLKRAIEKKLLKRYRRDGSAKKN